MLMRPIHIITTRIIIHTLIGLVIRIGIIIQCGILVCFGIALVFILESGVYMVFLLMDFNYGFTMEATSHVTLTCIDSSEFIIKTI